MKNITLTSIVLLIAMGVCLHPSETGAQDCRKSACRSGDTYDVRQRRCESGPNFWGYRSHYEPKCPDGYDLDPANGVCVKRGECCEKPACKKDDRWDRQDGRCESGPTFLGYRSHYTPKCETGWELDGETGLCKKRGCGIRAPGVVAHPATGYRPDLVIEQFGLLRWGSCQPGRVVFTFQVTVANKGTVASPAVLVQAIDQHSVNWGNGVRIGPIGARRSATVTISIAYLRSRPGHMTGAAPHPFKAVADPLKEIDESDEDNNESAVINVGAPRACSTGDQR